MMELFAALRESVAGTPRHFAAAQQFRRFRAEADIGLDLVSTRLSPL